MLHELLHKLFDDLLDLLSPRYCAICGARLGTSEREVCTKCLLDIPYFVDVKFEDNLVTRQFWGRVPVERGSSYMLYNKSDSSHLLLVQLKYSHRPDVGRWIGELMASDLRPKGFFDNVDCIMAVPLHWRRQLKRGYNQSEQLARGVAKVTGLPLLKGYVRRIRNNPTQTHKTAEERYENVKELFRLRRRIPYSSVLLIDDVLTTGATLTSCIKAILEQQPELRISVLTMAKANY